MNKFFLTAQAVFIAIIMPHFSDLTPEFNGAYQGTLQEFTIIDNVSMAKGTPIVDIFKRANILKRRDNSCEVEWSKIARASTRKITVDEIYGATKICEVEFYQGCLKDLEDGNNNFAKQIVAFFKSAIGMDVATNAYFGDISRASDDEFSWNVFDGVMTKVAKYVSENNPDYKPTIAGAIPAGTITPANAFAYFQSAVDAQPSNLENAAPTQKYFTVDYDLAKALWRYYQSIGEKSGDIYIYQNGQPTLQFDGIPVLVEPTWKAILKKLNGGTQAHSLVLTLRKNFIWGTNSKFNKNLTNGKALKVWYSEDDFHWKYLMELVAGTEIISPKDIVVLQTEFA